jgi:transcriptional regulator with XRE-family HTH domain
VERAEVSRRLKAARALAGVKVSELAEREALRANGITANLIGETERQERDARPMELRVIAEALDLPSWFFTTDLNASSPPPGNMEVADEMGARLEGFETALAKVDERLDALIEAVRAGIATSEQLGVLQAQMIEVRSHLNLPWRGEDAGASHEAADQQQSRPASAR